MNYKFTTETAKLHCQRNALLPSCILCLQPFAHAADPLSFDLTNSPLEEPTHVGSDRWQDFLVDESAVSGVSSTHRVCLPRTFMTLSRHLDDDLVATEFGRCMAGEELHVTAWLPSQAAEAVSDDLVHNVRNWGRTRALERCEMGSWRLIVTTRQLVGV